MGESSTAEATKGGGGGVGGSGSRTGDQPISILNNRSNSVKRATHKHGGGGPQVAVAGGMGVGGTTAAVDARAAVGRATAVSERSLRGSPVRDGGSVGSAAARAFAEPVSAELLEQRIRLVTNGLDLSPDSSLVGSVSSLNSPLSVSKASAGVAAVSFTVPGGTEKISHRGSISTRPGAKGEADSDTSTNSSRQNSLVHMPGDFIYFDSSFHIPLTPVSPHQTSSTSSLGRKYSQHHSNKAVIGEETGPQVPFTKFFQKQDDEKIHILIGATGSVATLKVPLIIDKLFKIYTSDKVSIQLIVTQRAEHFLKGLKISKDVKLWRDEDEWFGFKRLGDPVLHVELRKWADIFLVAPLSANTLAKVANGICDNLLTSVLRVWNPSTPVLVAPAMNTFMYTHPVTKKHLLMLQEDAPYVQILKPVEKVLVCGDIGMGGMREWIEIVEILVKSISKIRGAAAVGLQENEEEEETAGNYDDDDDDDERHPGDAETDETDDSAVSDEEDDEGDDATGSVQAHRAGAESKPPSGISPSV
ncbi:ADR156Cp [Eremothecium gossypii ATCC 10895]|uniref:ADR156Cp n=1 Tax=Eremothecium gossypii (strain ATCC 10895 / CBS 109.51 / FGSC 9923 / NRRL Y-1056) TaxID=284811 RepID=Q759W6_EREGS|nr:ADR156Cp [Eremothecium gossypii ATCC 10895]AAS52077.1 ADR156Cp [Eremothecium gossypii ATCC 10895]AEY96376.1 FADR156Cp [Eremothecium gossypii FDAG1]